MKRQGQIGQILTSFPSLIFVFVIMLIFVFVSGFLAKDLKEDMGGISENLRPFVDGTTRIDSIVLFDIFLEEAVSKEELNDPNLKGEYVSIGSLIEAIAGVSVEKQRNIIQVVQNRFHEKFSDGGKNKLKIIKFDEKTSKKFIYIDYPASYPEFVFPINGVSAESTEFNVCRLYNSFTIQGYSKNIGDVSKGICVYVEVV